MGSHYVIGARARTPPQIQDHIAFARTDLDEALPLNLVMGSSAFRLLANGICIEICEQLGTITGSLSLDSRCNGNRARKVNE